MRKLALYLFILTLIPIATISAEDNFPVPFRNGNRCGYADRDMNIVIKPQYDACGDMIDGIASVMRNGKYGFINAAGKEIVSPVYTYSSSINKGHAIVGIENRYAVINSKGNPVIPFIDYQISSYSDGIAVISKDYIYGLMGAGEKIILPVKYSRLDPVGKSLFIAAEPGREGSFFAGKCFLYNSKGALVLKDGYDNIYPAANGFIKIQSGEKWGYIYQDGRIIVPPVYDDIKNIKRDGTSCFKKDGKWGIINGKGIVIVKPAYDDVSGGDGTIDEMMQAGSESFIVLINGSYGIISMNGETIAPPKYMMITQSPSGYFTAYRAADETSGSQGSMGLTLLNNRGEELFKPRTEFNTVGEEGDGFVPAGSGGSYGSRKIMTYIDHKGERVSILWGTFDDAGGFSNGYAVVKRDGKYGIINTSGTLVEYCIYEELTRSANYPGLFEAYISGAKVYLEPGGKHFWK